MAHCSISVPVWDAAKQRCDRKRALGNVFAIAFLQKPRTSRLAAWRITIVLSSSLPEDVNTALPARRSSATVSLHMDGD
jgi:hypothetical protein